MPLLYSSVSYDCSRDLDKVHGSSVLSENKTGVCYFLKINFKGRSLKVIFSLRKLSKKLKMAFLF